MKRQINWFSFLLWIVYLALLAVLLPYTAWALGYFESPAVVWFGVKLGFSRPGAAVIAFESAIAARSLARTHLTTQANARTIAV